MLRFVVERIVRLVLVLLAITVVSFAFIHAIPGDPVALRLGEHASPQEVAHLRVVAGARPAGAGAARCCISARSRTAISASRSSTRSRSCRNSRAYFPATLELTLGAMLFAVLVGIPAGVIAAVRHRSAVDALTMSAVMLGVSIPVFWLGWILVYLLAVVPSHAGLNLFPISGPHRDGVSVHRSRAHASGVLDALLAGNGRAALDALWHLVLPAVTLGTIPLAIIAKITRSGMLDVLSSDYIRTARAKGLAQRGGRDQARAAQRADPDHHRARACRRGCCSAARC